MSRRFASGQQRAAAALQLHVPLFIAGHACPDPRAIEADAGGQRSFDQMQRMARPVEVLADPRRRRIIVAASVDRNSISSADIQVGLFLEAMAGGGSTDRHLSHCLRSQPST